MSDAVTAHSPNALTSAKPWIASNAVRGRKRSAATPAGSDNTIIGKKLQNPTSPR